MELRVLRYFLAVAREESISGAAEYLHLSQPTLSRQLIDLEKELGCKLLNRGKRNHKVILTEDGMRLRRRAEEIVELADKTKTEFSKQNDGVSGDIYIGGGESESMRLLAKTAFELQKTYPHIRYHLYSGNAHDVAERLEKGLLDFAVLVGDADKSKYAYTPLPTSDTWGLLLRRDDPLAQKPVFSAHDLKPLPLIMSQQALSAGELSGWYGNDFDKLNIVATYNLIFNASLLVEERVGYALTLDKLINTANGSKLCFRPLDPQLKAQLCVAWKKYQIFSPAAAIFIKELQKK